MKILNMQKGEGKTTRLLEMMVQDEELVLVTSTVRMAITTFDMSRRLNLNLERKRFLAVSQIQTLPFGMKPKRIVVDELDSVLNFALGSVVAVGTITEFDL